MSEGDQMESGFDEVPVGPSQTEAIKDGRGPDDSVNGQASDFDKNLPPLDDFIEEFKYVYEWKIESWSKLSEKGGSTFSDTFIVNGYKWRILLFPNGNTTDRDVACFLDSEDSHDSLLDPSWHVYPHISTLRCTQQISTKAARHRFSRSENDWGFNNIVPISELRGTGRGPNSKPPLLIDDKIIIAAYLRGYKDENGVLWHKFDNWDSRKETGYVGLRNQGATCYMNSLLQSLYFIPIFCRSTFKIPTENEKPTESVALALQRLFYNLATSPDTVSTHELTKSFGWGANDSYLQHDVQEFNRVLQDSLENKMKGTVAEKAISRLFQGKMKSVIRCLKVQCESSRTEDFYDIQLNVKGCRNLNDSFMEYIKKETLEDDNKYYSSEHGFQDATKGVIFEYFPPILHLQLKRFEFDFNSNSMIKINDYYEFPLKFSIRDYLEDALQFKEGDLIYHLHGVLVHSGDLHCGHYCAFIRPGVENKWFKFDDERVSPASEKEALNQNYGESSQDNMDESMEINYSRLKREVMYAKNHKKYTNAYMLVYLKESERDELLEPLSIEEDVPEHLISSIERENTHLENLKKERIESSKFIDVRILTDEVIEKHYGHGIASTRGDQEPSDLCFIFKRENTIGSLREFVADKLDLNPEKFRLWVTSQRQMGQCRPDTLLTPKQDKDYLHSICEMPKVFLQRQRTITIYLEKLSDDELNNGNHPNAINKKMLDSLKESNIILYLKFYDPSSKQVTYVGSAVVDKKAKVSDVVNILRDRRSLPSSSIIAVYEEPRPLSADIQQIDQNITIQRAGIISGSILCFDNITFSDASEESGIYQYYDNVLDSVNLTLIPKKTNKLKGLKTINILANRNDRAEELVARIVNTPNFPVRDALRMRLWMTPLDLSPARDVYGGLFFPERFCGDVTLSQFLELTFRQPPYPVVSQPSILEYDIIDPSIGDISQKIIFSVSYVDRSLRRVGTYDIVVPSDGTVLTLICEFLCCVNVEEGGTGLLRAIEFKKMRDIRSLRPNDLLSSISELSQLYIEELPQDELLIPTSRDLCVAKDSILGDQKQFDAAMHERKVMRALPPETYDIPSNIDCGNYEFSDPNTSGAFTINCLSFSRELSRPNGIPFRFVVIPGEPFSDTKKRLRARMGVEKYFSKIQYIITSPSYNNAVVLQDDMVLSDFQWTGGELLECDHFGKSNRVTRYTSEKPVRIHG